MVLKVFKLKQNAKTPTRGTKYSAGLDLYACLDKPTIIKPGQRKIVSNGFSMSLPEGYEGQIRSRSGLAFKNGVIVLTPGTVDADYRGEVNTLLYNSGEEDFLIENGMRIAQMVIAKYSHCKVQEVDNEIELEILELNERQKKGWGSTGLK